MRKRHRMDHLVKDHGALCVRAGSAGEGSLKASFLRIPCSQAMALHDLHECSPIRPVSPGSRRFHTILYMGIRSSSKD